MTNSRFGRRKSKPLIAPDLEEVLLESLVGLLEES